MGEVEVVQTDFDDGADETIRACMDPAKPRSFLLYAGAGSGKTRSLDKALRTFRKEHGEVFRRQGKKVAVITYTNAAADEIAERVGEDPLFPVSTIHSFCWQHIGSFHGDIRRWLLERLPDELAKVQEEHAKGKAGTKAARDRPRKIATLERRIEWLGAPQRFTYNPNGDNFGRNSLSHAEVLKLAVHFIEAKPSMGAILANRYPFLLIDESQDTNKALLEAFFSLAATHESRFAVGLFGDMMQRIFPDGHPELEKLVPESWARPAKRLNHRSPTRIVALGNALRAPVDNQRQVVREDAKTGVVRLFVAPSDAIDKPMLEQRVQERMATTTNDSGWCDVARVKTLALEHRMAASRGGFLEMFDALSQDPRLSNGLRKGELAGLRLFTERVAPLIAAVRAEDAFGAMAHLRAHSPLLKRTAMNADHPADGPLAPARAAVDALTVLNPESPSTTYLNVLECVAEHGLFEIPEALQPFTMQRQQAEDFGVGSDFKFDISLDTMGDTATFLEDTASREVDAWRAFLETRYAQTDPYAKYVADRGPFGTHQGVKGLEFDRVLVILDDAAAAGNFFSYDRLFGAAPLSDTDLRHLKAGTESGLDRTRRLLYVACTRARKSLALMAYTNDPDALTTVVLRDDIFLESEIERAS